jgi:hypothetical protein
MAIGRDVAKDHGIGAMLGIRRGALAGGLLGIAGLALAGSALAADENLEAKWRHACWKDAFNNCTFRALAGDRNGVRDCLVRNIDKISKPCRDVIESAREQGITDAKTHGEPASATQAAPANEIPR